MPTYEYQCKDCGYKFEKFQNMSDKPLKECPKCGKGVKRLIGTGTGVIFKGKDSMPRIIRITALPAELVVEELNDATSRLVQMTEFVKDNKIRRME